MTNIPTVEPNGFDGLGIAPKLLEILGHLQFTTPTPIQTKSIPVAITGSDIVGIAQTGTGKTLAFGIPMIQRIAREKGRGLVVLPTRELALQVNENLIAIGQSVGLRTSVLIGGESMARQLMSLKKNPHIIVATPGRLIDHMHNAGLKLDTVKILVLDEADMMFDMGFAPQLNEILKNVPKARQTMLFSATMPQTIMALASKHMTTPVRVGVAPPGTSSENVSQEMVIIKKEDRAYELEHILSGIQGSVLVFMRTKYGAKDLTRRLNKDGFSAAEIHSNRSLVQRREALSGFKDGKYRVLVATDIAARGIDVKGIEVVVNYDLPENPEDYVHRIGRTGRAGQSGKAISFVLPTQVRDVKTIERLIKKVIPSRQHKGAGKIESVARPAKADFYGSTEERKQPVAKHFDGPKKFSNDRGGKFPRSDKPFQKKGNFSKPFEKKPDDRKNFAKKPFSKPGSAARFDRQGPKTNSAHPTDKMFDFIEDRPLTDKDRFRLQMRGAMKRGR